MAVGGMMMMMMIMETNVSDLCSSYLCSSYLPAIEINCPATCDVSLLATVRLFHECLKTILFDFRSEAPLMDVSLDLYNYYKNCIKFVIKISYSCHGYNTMSLDVADEGAS